MMAFSPTEAPVSAAAITPAKHRARKRKADTHDVNHERLNKRMSLLNLEQNGPKLYVPVEQPQPPPTTTYTHTPSQPPTPPATLEEDEPMQLDDTKHKVYIYDLASELSDSSDSEPEGRLVLLPDLAAHLRANRSAPLVPAPLLRIPRPLPPPNSAGVTDDALQVVLYQPDGPPSLSVPAEHDGVRRAIVAARERVRERQAAELLRNGGMNEASARESVPRKTMMSFATPVKFPAAAVRDDMSAADEQAMMGGQSSWSAGELDDGYDPDAMDID